MPAGDHQVSWDGRDDQGRKLPNGTYFLRMAINGLPVPEAGKAVLLR
jgi:flagellar hook assembly protein FlgD